MRFDEDMVIWGLLLVRLFWGNSWKKLDFMLRGLFRGFLVFKYLFQDSETTLGEGFYLLYINIILFIIYMTI